MIKVKSKLIQPFNGKGLEELKKKLTGADQVKVGFASGEHYSEDNQTVASVALIHEFGSDDGEVPERSFMRSSIHANAKKYVALNKQSLAKVVRKEATTEQALAILGEVAKSDMQQKIRQGPFTPLADVTIKAKGSSKPLIDTGQMVQSVTYIVEPKK